MPEYGKNTVVTIHGPEMAWAEPISRRMQVLMARGAWGSIERMLDGAKEEYHVLHRSGDIGAMPLRLLGIEERVVGIIEGEFGSATVNDYKSMGRDGMLSLRGIGVGACIEIEEAIGHQERVRKTQQETTNAVNSSVY